MLRFISSAWLFFIYLVFGLSLHAIAQMTVTPFVPNVSRVTDITNCGDERLFIVEQVGRIRISDLQGNLNPVPFLDITSRVNASGGEQGLLGLAFSPDFALDRKFYVNYINNSGNTVISRFTASVSNPDSADSFSEEILFSVIQPFSNHNGGAMHFGPDGYLYLSLGDGGSGGDPQGNSQNLQSRLGKLLRIQVGDSLGYTIPSTNPFLGNALADSMVWAYGLRNAWRFAFDDLTGDLWIADVGQGLWEEVNFTPAGSTGGENYGWRCYEGNAPFNLTNCLPISEYTFPIHTYSHPSGCSVTGGYVYRGAKYASWFGKYFFTDYCNGIIQSLTPADTGGFILESYGSFGNNVFSTFGQDRYGELYIGKATSGVFKLNDSTCAPVAFIAYADTLQSNSSTLMLHSPFGPGLSYQWYFNDELIPGATTNVYKATLSGNYKIIVINSSLCTTESKTIVVLLKTRGEFSISPNPAGDFAEITWSTYLNGAKKLELYDVQGRLCKRVTVGENIYHYNLDTFKFTKGVYFLRMIYNDESYYIRFVIR